MGDVRDVEELRRKLTRVLLCEVFPDDTTALSLDKICASAPVQRWRRACGPFVEQLADQLADDDDLLPTEGYEQRPLWEVRVETEIKRLRSHARVTPGPERSWIRGTRWADVVIVPDDTSAVWEFRAHTDSAKTWLELCGNNIRRVGTYDFIVLQDHDSVAAMRASAEERADLIVDERGGLTT